MIRPFAVCVTLLVAVYATVEVTGTAAAWRVQQAASGSLTAASSACTASGLYTGTSTSRLIVGSVGTSPLDPVAALAGIRVDDDGTTAAPTPSTAIPAGAEAWRSAIAASALNGTLTAGSSAGLPVSGATGAFSQWASAHSTGAASSASGAVTSGGAIDDAAIGAGTAPTVGTVDLGSVLTSAGHASALPALSGLTVRIGAVASTSAINACTAAWGGDGTARGYRVGAVRLVFDDASVDGLRTALRSATSSITSAATTLEGAPSSATSAAESSVQTTAAGALGSILLAAAPAALIRPTVSSSATVTIDAQSGSTGLTGLAAALSEVRTDPTGLVTADFGSGILTVDLSALAGLDGRPANTALLSTSAAAAIRSAVASLVTGYRQDVADAWAAMRAGATVTVSATSTLSSVVAGVTTPLVTATAGATGSASAFASGTESRSGPTVTLLGSGIVNASALQTALTAVGVSGFFAPVDGAAGSAISSALDGPISAARSTTTTALTTATSSLAADLAPLPNVVRLTVNVQPDAAPYPAPWTGASGAGSVSVSALRVELAVGGADDLDVRLGNSAAGPGRPVG